MEYSTVSVDAPDVIERGTCVCGLQNHLDASRVSLINRWMLEQAGTERRRYRGLFMSALEEPGANHTNVGCTTTPQTAERRYVYVFLDQYRYLSSSNKSERASLRVQP